MNNSVYHKNSSQYRCKQQHDVCYRGHHEESFASLFALQSTSAQNQSNVLRRMCFGARDHHHALGSDNVRCALLTPSLREKIIQATSCQ